MDTVLRRFGNISAIKRRQQNVEDSSLNRKYFSENHVHFHMFTSFKKYLGNVGATLKMQDIYNILLIDCHQFLSLK